MPGGNKAVQVVRHVKEEPGAGLQVVDADKPSPGPGQVLVRVTLRSVNPADVMVAAGGYPGENPLPTVPGLEGMGKVEELGQGVEGFRSGQRVVGCPFNAGSWQQYVLAEEGHLYAVPDRMSDEQAAQFYLNPFTAWGLLDSIGAPEGAWVLQTAAASVVGRMFIQMARVRKNKSINVVRRQEQVEELKALGADEVLVITDKDTEGTLAARVSEITGGQLAWGAADAIGGAFTAQVCSAVRPYGTTFVYGQLSKSPAMHMSARDGFRECGVKGFNWRGWLERLGDRNKGEMDRVAELIMAGTAAPHTGKHYPLEQAAAAVAHSLQPAHGGKVLLEG